MQILFKKNNIVYEYFYAMTDKGRFELHFYAIFIAGAPILCYVTRS